MKYNVTKILNVILNIFIVWIMTTHQQLTNKKMVHVFFNLAKELGHTWKLVVKPVIFAEFTACHQLRLTLHTMTTNYIVTRLVVIIVVVIIQTINLVRHKEVTESVYIRMQK